MTIPLFVTRGTVQVKDIEIVGSLLGNILDVTGTITLDGTHIFIRLKGAGPYTVTLPSIASVGAIIITLWVRDTITPTISIVSPGGDRISGPPGSLTNTISLTSRGHSVTLMADASDNVWFVIATNNSALIT